MLRLILTLICCLASFIGVKCDTINNCDNSNDMDCIETTTCSFVLSHNNTNGKVNNNQSNSNNNSDRFNYSNKTLINDKNRNKFNLKTRNGRPRR